MTGRARVLVALPAAALAFAVLTGCGQHDRSAAPAAPAGATAPSATAGSTSPAPSASELAHMQKLVDDADSAAAEADSDAAGDK